MSCSPQEKRSAKGGFVGPQETFEPVGRVPRQRPREFNRNSLEALRTQRSPLVLGARDCPHVFVGEVPPRVATSGLHAHEDCVSPSACGVARTGAQPPYSCTQAFRGCVEPFCQTTREASLLREWARSPEERVGDISSSSRRLDI